MQTIVDALVGNGPRATRLDVTVARPAEVAVTVARSAPAGATVTVLACARATPETVNTAPASTADTALTGGSESVVVTLARAR